MTSNDEWAKKQAWELWNGFNDQPSERAILAAIQEAIERGKAEQDKAVAAERERCAERLLRWEELYAKANGQRNAAEAKLARLADPDRPLIASAAFLDLPEELYRDDKAQHQLIGTKTVDAVCRALARTLTEGQENSDG